MATGEVKSEVPVHFEWNVENEIHLFEAMIGYKPVGIHKHFHMACICEKFETLLGKPVSPDVIWNHLGDIYDLAALDKKDSVQLPNEVEEFMLPVADFSELIAEKLSKTEIVNEVITKDDKNLSKTAKDPSQGNDSIKKERRTEGEENGSEPEKKEAEETETDSKKGKLKKEEKVVGKRGKRSLKDKKHEEENIQVTAPNVKRGDDHSSTTQSMDKKGKRIVGKRSLRSRADDASHSKSSTPPPTKRTRRI